MSGTSGLDRAGLVGAVIAVSLAAGAVGCAGGDDEAPKEGGEFVAGTLLCGGEAVSTEAAESLSFFEMATDRVMACAAQRTRPPSC